LGSKLVISVPARAPDQVGKTRVAALVYCKNPLDPEGNAKYLREVCGRPLIRTMAERLSNIHSISQTLMLIGQDEPRTVGAALQLGWEVIVAPKLLRDLRRIPLLSYYRLAKADCFALFTLDDPFIDPELTLEMFSAMSQCGETCLYTTNESPFLPRYVIGRGQFLRAALRAAYRGTPRAAMKYITATGYPFSAPEAPSISNCLHSSSASTSIIELLGGINFRAKTLREKLNNPDFARRLVGEQRSRLRDEMSSQNPRTSSTRR
jgi:molybdopterin-guanine dinucleotide biosynthesis protein A